MGYFSATSISQSTACSLVWADIYLALTSMSFCNVGISSSGAELSESKRDLTLVAMSPTPIEEQQIFQVNTSHDKSIKNILNLTSRLSF